MRTGMAAAVAMAVLVWNSAECRADDRFLAGYATAVLEREFALTSPSLSVMQGIVTLTEADLAGANRQAVIDSLSNIRGIEAVRVLPAGTAHLPDVEQPPVVAAVPNEGVLLPRRFLFDPLLADPRWPHFSAAYHYYPSDQELQDVAAVSFGETFSFYEAPLGDAGRWSLGFQAGVFAIFDLDAESKDLINADYWVGIPVAYRNGDFSAITRLFHQSSHLGDEYLLRRKQVDRINLSYEAVDAKLSYDIGAGFRLYGGGGYMFDLEPADLKPWTGQIGGEYRSPWTFASGRLRPLAAIDLQATEESDWTIDSSVRLGVQLEGRRVSNYAIQLLAEYFHGRNPNGQFYDRSVKYYGLGLHLAF